MFRFNCFLVLSFLLVTLSACNESATPQNTKTPEGPSNAEIANKIKQDYVVRCSKSGDFPASVCSCAFDKIEQKLGRFAILQTEKDPIDSPQTKKFNIQSSESLLECLDEANKRGE